MKRDQVIEAARKLFHKFGFQKVSMDEIASEAGVTKKTVYTYFSSNRKQQDFLNIIAREAEWLKKPIIIESLSMIDEKIQNYIKNKLQKAKEKGYIDYIDLDITTFLIYKMYIALIIEWNTKEKKINEQMLAQTISEILKKGLRKEEKKNE